MKAPQRRKLFDRIYARDGGRCVYCGAIVRRPGPSVRRTPTLATLDHVVPRSNGGRLESGNLVLACRACNNERGVMDAGAFHARKARERGTETQEAPPGDRRGFEPAKAQRGLLILAGPAMTCSPGS